MKLFYDKNDLQHSKKLRDDRFTWLKELGATELSEADPHDAGFLFGYEHGDEHYRTLVEDRPRVRDRPEERENLVRLDLVLERLIEHGVDVPTPKTWIIGIDDAPPADLEFPVFVRTPKSSWKRGGTQARANNLRQLDDEVELLRRAFGWDTPILARKWIDVAVRRQMDVRRRTAGDPGLDRRSCASCLVVPLSSRRFVARRLSAEDSGLVAIGRPRREDWVRIHVEADRR